MIWQLDNFIQDIDYIANQLISQGILPSDFYQSSFSEMQTALNAKSRKDRVQDPLELARQIGAL
ncbi:MULTISPECIES: hypothetical protein [Lactiplantibacillus]|jgi:hypothetical protein|uniref:Uncharacterized protein n=5 Tax=root TaxID=1 RepID=A0A0G9GJN3_LACPN|nr:MULTISPECIES: hypothetical protein [Lactiplantibacillus]YP_007003565.1 hypothetical protein F375_gp25 [Lactobacillus phage Sha1]KAA4797546.1 hypothetical protein F2048_23860 [Bacteroides fragilis]MBJ7525532.1 hypothetical protein [Lactobacillus sp. CRM56-2]MDN6028903.1 hypothetical protein [Lactobacillus sp.]TYA05069.1 hypothetical protein FXE15_06220 [Lactobacillus sp. CAB1-7]TYA18913.1 hypothetical protein FXE14_07440 [Lactobacillus sp. LSI2-1]DAF51226.1 MAG TPA: hypothetical protein [S